MQHATRMDGKKMAVGKRSWLFSALAAIREKDEEEAEEEEEGHLKRHGNLSAFLHPLSFRLRLHMHSRAALPNAHNNRPTASFYTSLLPPFEIWALPPTFAEMGREGSVARSFCSEE